MLSTELSSRMEGLCHTELLPEGSAELLSGHEHQPLVLPRGKICFLPWLHLESKGDQIRAAAAAQIWMLGKPYPQGCLTRRVVSISDSI